MATGITDPSATQKSYLTDIILGSGSFTRKQILSEAGVSYTVVKADIDERGIGNRDSGDNAHELVLLLANAKADAILRRIGTDDNMKGKVLLTADQVVVCDNKILEKPITEEITRSYIKMYGSHPCSTVGSIVLTDISSGKRVSGVDSATILFDEIPQTVVNDLIAEGTVMQCAGGLMIEHPLVKKYIKRIDGSIDSVMGLSLNLYYDLSKQLLK